jgi:hypothetical protein
MGAGERCHVVRLDLRRTKGRMFCLKSWSRRVPVATMHIGCCNAKCMSSYVARMPMESIYQENIKSDGSNFERRIRFDPRR